MVALTRQLTGADVTASSIQMTVVNTVKDAAHYDAFLALQAVTPCVSGWGWAIAGIAVAVGSVVVIYWRKAKKRINEKMGIDLDKNKEVEEDIIVTDDDQE